MEIKVIKSKRKTLALVVKTDKSVIVKAPVCATDNEIEIFVQKHKSWIEKQIKNMPDMTDVDYFTDSEIKDLAERALEYIPKRVEYFASLIGVSYGKITIRNQKTRWGSCSSKGNLNFNCVLMMMPSEVIDSVIVHELCHRKEMNHSKKFYAEVLKIFPNYYECRKYLKENGQKYIMRLR